MQAVSFAVRLRGSATASSEVGRAFTKALAQVSSASGAVLFSSANVASDLSAIAHQLLPLVPQGFPVLLASGSSVITDQEGDPGLAGLVFHARNLRLTFGTESPLNAAALAPHWSQGQTASTLLFARAEDLDSEQFWAARSRTGEAFVFGAATSGSPGLVAIQDGKVTAASVAALQLGGLGPPYLRSASACRLLHTMAPITRTERGLVLELGGRPALARLKELRESGVQSEPAALCAVLAGRADPEGNEVLIRQIRGVDPDRGGVLIGPEVCAGMFMAFGVRDAVAARTELETRCRELRRSLAGGAPSFGLYFGCGDRGGGPSDSDSRVLREAFPKLPFAGLQSSFDIAPFESKPASHLHSSVLSIFSSPS